MHIWAMNTEMPKALVGDFDYNLPAERIALHPPAKRGDSKLLIYRNGEMFDGHFEGLPSFLESNTLMYFNHTKVVHARLLFEYASKPIEVFCMQAAGEHSLAPCLNNCFEARVEALVGGARRWKSGKLFLQWPVGNDTLELQAEKLGEQNGLFLIDLKWNLPITLADVLGLFGHVPLPPYLKRLDELEDVGRYQTVYAQSSGSVAAPTAGLHFTPELLDLLDAKGIKRRALTLHVGAGTFKPMQGESAAEHLMHAEEIILDLEELKAIQSAASEGICAVGTTSLRTLESLYWMGLRCINEGHNRGPLPQNYPYKAQPLCSVNESLEALYQWHKGQGHNQLHSLTQLFVVPAYSFKLVNKLITNFHQPKSTLLMLIAAFIGDDWRKLYQYALENNYRFLSYGDAQLLHLKP